MESIPSPIGAPMQKMFCQADAKTTCFTRDDKNIIDNVIDFFWKLTGQK
jgi:hypothetical protein